MLSNPLLSKEERKREKEGAKDGMSEADSAYYETAATAAAAAGTGATGGGGQAGASGSGEKAAAAPRTFWNEARHLTGGVPRPTSAPPSWKLSSTVCHSRTST